MKSNSQPPSPLVKNRADPHISLHDGWYYFTASVPEYDRLELRRAKTVEGLASALPKVLWYRHLSGPQSRHIWAPELHRFDGNWYLYYAAGEVDDPWKIRPFVLLCMGSDPMEAPWTELGPVQAADGDPFSFRDFSLDATILECQGTRYLVWAQKVGGSEGISNLYIARMESPLKLATVQVQLTTPDYPWERVGFWVNEGPAVLVRHGRVWLTFSASSTGASYCLGLLSASVNSDFLDPASWTKERSPVLVSNGDLGQYGPGHNSFAVAEDGTTDLIFYHARTYAEIQGDPLEDPNRHTWVRPVQWTADGFPLFI